MMGNRMCSQRSRTSAIGRRVATNLASITSTAINVGGLALRSEKYGDRQAQVPARPYLTAPVDVLFVAVVQRDPHRAAALLSASYDAVSPRHPDRRARATVTGSGS